MKRKHDITNSKKYSCFTVWLHAMKTKLCYLGYILQATSKQKNYLKLE